MSHDLWFTPTEIIEPIREFYKGVIDLDPASCCQANKTIKANKYRTYEGEAFNGLLGSWNGNVWCNPPYLGKDTVKSWVQKACNEYSLSVATQIIMLLNRSDAKWYYEFLDNHRGGYYQFRNRIKFIDGLTGKPSGPRYNNDLVYWGKNIAQFQSMCIRNFGKPVPTSK